MGPLVLGLDLGTTEVRAGLFDLRGQPVDIARRDYPTRRGPDGSAEQDPADWWAAVVGAVTALRPAVAGVRAICPVGQGPTLVAVGPDGAAVRPAITWMDTRPDRSSPDDPEGIAGFTIRPPIAWMAEHEPATVERARWLLNAWDWLAMRLTGVAVTSLQPGERPVDVAAAAERVPAGVAVGTAIGTLRPDVAADLGLPRDAQVIAGTNDGAATIVGAGVHEPGEAVDVGGASGGIAVISREPRTLPGIYCAPALYPGRWVLGGAMMAIGSSLTWLRTAVLGDHWTIDELIAEAAAVPPGAEGLLFLPYLAGERSPIWDPDARGAFVGLTLGHDRAHLTRAVLEGGAFALRHVLMPITESGVTTREVRLAGRPARSGVWSQIKSDVLGIATIEPLVVDAAVLGAATIAAVGAGLLPDLDAATGQMRGERARFAPREENRATYDSLFDVYLGLYPALRPAFGALARR